MSNTTNSSRDDLYLTDVARIIDEFYKDVETIGTTDAVINAIEKAYKAGVNVGANTAK